MSLHGGNDSANDHRNGGEDFNQFLEEQQQQQLHRTTNDGIEPTLQDQVASERLEDMIQNQRLRRNTFSLREQQQQSDEENRPDRYVDPRTQVPRWLQWYMNQILRSTNGNSDNMRADRHNAYHLKGVQLYLVFSVIVAIIAVMTSPSTRFLFTSFSNEKVGSLPSGKVGDTEAPIVGVSGPIQTQKLTHSKIKRINKDNYSLLSKELILIDHASNILVKRTRNDAWISVAAKLNSRLFNEKVVGEEKRTPPPLSNSVAAPSSKNSSNSFSLFYSLEDLLKTAWSSFREHVKEKFSLHYDGFNIKVQSSSISMKNFSVSNNQDKNIFDSIRWISPVASKKRRDNSSNTVMNINGKLLSISSISKKMNPFVLKFYDTILPFLIRPLGSIEKEDNESSTGNHNSLPNNSSYSEFIEVFDEIFTSTPRFIAIVNLLLAVTFLLYTVVADLFLGSITVRNTAAGAAEATITGGAAVVGGNNLTGTILPPVFPSRESPETNSQSTLTIDEQSRRQRRLGRERLCGYLLLKLLLVSAVVEPDTFDLLILLLWFTTLSLLRSLCYVAGSTIHQAAQSGQTSRPGALRLLILVLVCDCCAAVGFVALFYSSGWNIILLLTCDCVLLCADAMAHIVRHIGSTLEERHRGRMVELEERIVNIHDRRRSLTHGDAIGDTLEEQSRSYDREVEASETIHSCRMAYVDRVVFTLELFTHSLTASHFLHIWSLHGASLGLVNCVLLLHLQSTLSSARRKITERRNLNRIVRELDATFNDASDLDIRKASTSGDVCCICLVTMTTGSVKKVGCGHLFHKNCLREVIERARSIQTTKCPLCRASLSDGTHSPHLSTQQNAINTVVTDIVPDDQRQIQTGGMVEILPTPVLNQTVNEQSLFRFSTEGILPAWFPVPAFAFEVVRRETPALVEQNMVNAGGLQRFFRRGVEVDSNVVNPGDGQQLPEQQTSFWRRLFILAGIIAMSPEEEAAALEQLVDMFPQYDRGDLSRELTARGSAEAVVEAVLLGVFSGTPRGGLET